VLLFKLDTEASLYEKGPKLTNLYRQIEERVSRLPGVGSQGVSLLSFSEGQRFDSFEVPGVTLPPDKRVSNINFISPGYFSVLKIPVMLGRPLRVTDTAASRLVTVISETLARQVFGDPVKALGRTIVFDEEKPAEIVGIARDIKSNAVLEKDLRMGWFSVYQRPDFIHTLAVRVTGDTGKVATLVRSTIRAAEPNLPIRWTTTMSDAMSDSLVSERAIAQLSGFFAILALALSAIGLYGTISFAVARRTSEIGIRMALGAERTGVVGMVLRDAMLLTLAGIAVGLPLALVITRQMGSILYGLGSIDGVTVAASVIALSVVAMIAGYLPARRASKVDPMVALRYE
jgi:predicted permease